MDKATLGEHATNIIGIIGKYKKEHQISDCTITAICVVIAEAALRGHEAQHKVEEELHGQA